MKSLLDGPNKEYQIASRSDDFQAQFFQKTKEKSSQKMTSSFANLLKFKNLIDISFINIYLKII